MKQRPKNRQRRRRQRAGSYPLQLIGAATVVIFALFLLVMVVEKAARPYWLGHQGDRQVAELRARLSAQHRRNAELRAKAAYLRSSEGAEVLARQQGYRHPGEEVFHLPEGTAPAAPTGTITTSNVP